MKNKKTKRILCLAIASMVAVLSAGVDKLQVQAGYGYMGSEIYMQSIVENSYEKFPNRYATYGGVVYSYALNQIHEMVDNYYSNNPNYVYPKFLSKSQFDYVFYALYNPELLPIYGMNEDLLYQHYVDVGYAQGYRVCPKIQSYTVVSTWSGLDGKQYSRHETYHFDNYGGCTMVEAVDNSMNSHSLTQSLYHYDENHRPIRVDECTTYLNNNSYSASSYVMKNNELGLCTYMARVGDYVSGTGTTPQFVTSTKVKKYDEYEYDALGRCVYYYNHDPEGTDIKRVFEYGGVDANGQLLSHSIRCWETEYNMNQLAKRLADSNTNAYVYSQSEGDMMLSGEYRLYADRIHFYDAIYTLQYGSVIVHDSSNLPSLSGMVSNEYIFKVGGAEMTAEEYYNRYGHPDDKAVPSNELALPVSYKGSYGKTYTYSYVLYE